MEIILNILKLFSLQGKVRRDLTDLSDYSTGTVQGVRGDSRRRWWWWLKSERDGEGCCCERVKKQKEIQHRSNKNFKPAHLQVTSSRRRRRVVGMDGKYRRVSRVAAS